jgi:RNA polymerase sigma-70 factor (ECF subfamily)
MFEQCLENHNATETDRTQRAIARDEDGFLVAAKRGDSAAFEMLCKQSASTAFHIARRMMRSKEDAEDVVQESFQMAFIHLKSFKGSSRFSTWLSRIAINAALMKLRRKRHLRDVPLHQSTEAEEPSLRHDVEDQSPNPEELYAQQERQRILFEAMNGLTPGIRKAIELRELGERSTEETAQIMGISASAVKARVFHGRRKLRAKLKNYVGSALTSERRLHKSPITRETAHQIKWPAMRVVKAGSKRGSYDHASASHRIGDFDISVLHRPGCYRLETSTLNLVRESSVPTGQSACRAKRLSPRDEFAMGL